ncbi:MAG: hypothetical protein DRN92_02040 [Thermoproteota archaeon]|nr:MAG: hypothetical protein DRN92_02040 [Candidatus Korarchaeota archaeon]
MVFYTKIAVSLIAGLLAGILGISGVAGIAFFIFTFFLSTAILLTLKREVIFNLGFYKTYREGIGSSLIAFILTWSIATSLMLGQPTIYVADSSIGPHPVSFPNGTEVPPALKPLNSTFNAIYVIKLSENKTWKVMLGVYSQYNDETALNLPKCDLIYQKAESTVKLTTTIDPEELDQIKSRWSIKFSKEDEGVFIIYEGTRELLEEGKTIDIELKEADSTYLIHILYSANQIRLETEPLKMENNSLNMTRTPFGDTISYVCLDRGFIYAFECPLYTYRSIGFGEEYLVLERPP